MTTRIRRHRWYLKKAARRSFAATKLLCREPSSSAAPQVRVLTYHAFGDSPFDPFCVSLEAFDAQMTWLAERRLAIDLATFEAFLAGKAEVPDGAVLVTIDDGLASVGWGALPILERHRIPAVAFVTASLIDDGPRGVKYLSREQLSALAGSNVAIGSHALTHRSLGRMPPDEAEAEARRSRELLEAVVEQPVRAFAYPFGTRADFSPATSAALIAAGYTCGFTSQHGAVRPGLDAWTLPRIKVEGGEGVWVFRSLCRGGLDRWAWVDHALWRLQQRKG